MQYNNWKRNQKHSEAFQLKQSEVVRSLYEKLRKEQMHQQSYMNYCKELQDAADADTMLNRQLAIQHAEFLKGQIKHDQNQRMQQKQYERAHSISPSYYGYPSLPNHSTPKRQQRRVQLRDRCRQLLVDQIESNRVQRSIEKEAKDKQDKLEIELFNQQFQQEQINQKMKKDEQRQVLKHSWMQMCQTNNLNRSIDEIVHGRSKRLLVNRTVSISPQLKHHRNYERNQMLSRLDSLMEQEQQIHQQKNNLLNVLSPKARNSLLTKSYDLSKS